MLAISQVLAIDDDGTLFLVWLQSADDLAANSGFLDRAPGEIKELPHGAYAAIDGLYVSYSED